MKQSTKERKYQTTKLECQNRIGENVCDYCGRKLKPIKTIDNSNNPTYWIGCHHGGGKGAWGHFTGGTTKEIYNLAKKYILVYGTVDYSGRGEEFFKFNQIHEAVGIITKVRNLDNKHNWQRYKNWKDFDRIEKLSSPTE